MKTLTNNILRFLSKHDVAYSAVIAGLMHLLLLFSTSRLFWDEAAYIAHGIWLLSGGEIGVYEVFRPPILSIITGILWKFGLDPFVLGRALSGAAIVGSSILLCKLGRSLFGKIGGLLLPLFFAATTYATVYGTVLLTESFAIFLAILLMYLLYRNLLFWAGLTLGILFLTKYPFAIYGIMFMMILFRLFEGDGPLRWKLFSFDALKSLMGLMLVLVPYGVWMWLSTGHVFSSVVRAQTLISTLHECLVVINHDSNVYVSTIFSSLPLLLFATIGIVAALCASTKIRAFMWTSIAQLVVIMVYMSTHTCRDDRYVLFLVPIGLILSVSGVMWLFTHCTRNSWVSKHKLLSRIFSLGFLIVLTFAIGASVQSGFNWETTNPSDIQSYREIATYPGNISSMVPYLVLFGKYDFYPMYLDEDCYSIEAFEQDAMLVDSYQLSIFPLVSECSYQRNSIEKMTQENILYTSPDNRLMLVAQT